MPVSSESGGRAQLRGLELSATDIAMAAAFAGKDLPIGLREFGVDPWPAERLDSVGAELLASGLVVEGRDGSLELDAVLSEVLGSITIADISVLVAHVGPTATLTLVLSDRHHVVAVEQRDGGRLRIRLLPAEQLIPAFAMLTRLHLATSSDRPRESIEILGVAEELGPTWLPRGVEDRLEELLGPKPSVSSVAIAVRGSDGEIERSDLTWVVDELGQPIRIDQTAESVRLVPVSPDDIVDQFSRSLLAVPRVDDR